MAKPKLDQEPTAPYFGKGLTTICPDCEVKSEKSERRTQYIVVNGDFTFKYINSKSKSENRTNYVNGMRINFIAALWHYEKLSEANSALPESQREDIKIVGWKSSNPPNWLDYPSLAEAPSAKEKKLIEIWENSIDNLISPIQSIKDLFRATKSSKVSAIHYFSHGEERSLSFRKDYKCPPSKIEVENLRNHLSSFSPEEFPGRFTDDAVFYFYSCWAGRWDLDEIKDKPIPKDESASDMEKRLLFEAERNNRMQSVAAAFAQIFGITAFGCPFSIKLRINPRSTNFCQYFISESNPDDRFKEMKEKVDYPTMDRIGGRMPVSLYRFERYQKEAHPPPMASPSSFISKRFLGRELRGTIDMPPHFQILR